MNFSLKKIIWDNILRGVELSWNKASDSNVFSMSEVS